MPAFDELRNELDRLIEEGACHLFYKQLCLADRQGRTN